MSQNSSRAGGTNVKVKGLKAQNAEIKFAIEIGEKSLGYHESFSTKNL